MSEHDFIKQYKADREEWLRDEAKKRRNRIAELITASMVSGREWIQLEGEYTDEACARIVSSAVTLADALIAELDK